MSRDLNCPKCHGIGHVPADGYGREDCQICFSETPLSPTQGADARPVAITDVSIIAAFEYEMMNDPDAYTRPEECVYQITNKELLSATKKLLATRDAAPSDAPTDEQAMFESWCVSNGWLRINLERNPAAGYADADIDDMWDGWNARAKIAASAPREEKS